MKHSNKRRTVARKVPGPWHIIVLTILLLILIFIIFYVVFGHPVY